MKSLIRATAVLGVLVLSATASAEPLGVAGQIAITGEFDLRFQSTSYEGGDDSLTLLQIAPSADFFLAPNVSVGGQVLYSRLSGGDEATNNFGVAVRAGYVIGLGALSIWPRAGVGFGYAEGGNFDTSSFTLNLYAPINFHPADHFFIGIGPSLDYDLYMSEDAVPKATSFGVVSTVGGYF